MHKVPLKKIGDLKRGDIVYHKVTDNSYLITDVFGDRATGVSTADITNPIEWEVLKPDPLFTEKDMAGYRPNPKPGSRKFWHG